MWMAARGPNPTSVRDFEVSVERLVLRGDDASLAQAVEIATPCSMEGSGSATPLFPNHGRMLLDTGMGTFHNLRRPVGRLEFAVGASALTRQLIESVVCRPLRSLDGKRQHDVTDVHQEATTTGPGSRSASTRATARSIRATGFGRGCRHHRR